MRAATIDRNMFFMAIAAGILMISAPLASAQAASLGASKPNIPLPYPGYDPEREKAMAGCMQEAMPSKGMPGTDIARSDRFKFTPVIAQQIQDCLLKKGYKYDSPTLARAKKAIDQKTGDTNTPTTDGGTAPAQPSAELKPVPMLPLNDGEKQGTEPASATRRQPVFVEPETDKGSSSKPVFLKN